MYKVLVVDDERMIRQGIERAIPWSSLQVDQVFTAASAGEALEIVKNHPIDLLITDISMSEMTGLDLIGRIRESDGDMRVVVLTGYDRFDYAQQALKLRAHDFLLKPVDEEELRRSIESQLQILREQREARRMAGSVSRTGGVRQQYRPDERMEGFFHGRTPEQKRADMFQEVFREFKSAMAASVGDMDRTLHIFERFQVAVESYNLSARYTEQCCFELASVVAFSYLNDGGDQWEENLNALMKSLNGATREGACEVTEAFFQRLLSQKSGSGHELVRKVKSRIHGGLGEELTVAGIAAELYVTPNYLSRLFKRITGEGCNEYIVRKRIEKARALLEATNLKVGEIAAMVGYTDINYFSLAFKKHTGMSPTKYREALRESGEE